MHGQMRRVAQATRHAADEGGGNSAAAVREASVVFRSIRRPRPDAGSGPAIDTVAMNHDKGGSE